MQFSNTSMQLETRNFVCMHRNFEPAHVERNTYSPVLEILYVCIEHGVGMGYYLLSASPFKHV
jgi:hypothetical protein